MNERRPPLPIDPLLGEIRDHLARSPSLVLRAPPGAGKTTRVPAALIDDPRIIPRDKRLLMLEPRRVAARAAARRIAKERGKELGGEVGYQVRFDDRTSKDSRLILLTEGLLTRKLQSDPTLEDVAAVVLDEFHERSIHADLGLAFLREIQESVRPDLRIVVMSATLEPGPIARFLGGCPTVEAEGRSYPVDIRWLSAHSDDASDRPLDERVAAAVRRALSEPDDDGGDVLVFLPGAPEIRRAKDALEPSIGARVDLCPLYGDLDPDAQDRAIQKGSRRKVILATNIAETSLTIEGVTVVIDTGLAKIQRHDPARGFDRLDRVRISRASAEQRAGRAGRTAPGRAYRLWTRSEDRALAPYETPEIARVDLAPAVLEIVAWSGRDPRAFGFFEPPPRARIDSAVGLLLELGAIEVKDGGASYRLTSLGEKVRPLPLHPRLGTMLVAAHRRGVLDGGALLAALASERDVIRRGREGAPAFTESISGPSDLLLRADLISEKRRGGGGGSDLDRDGVRTVLDVRDRLRDLARRALGSPGKPPRDEESALLRVLLAGFPDRVARRRAPASERVVLVGGRGAKLAKESVVKDATLMLAIEVDDSRRGGQPGPGFEAGAESLIRIASAIEERWLAEDTHGLVEERVVRWNASRGAAEGIVQRRYEDLVLAERHDPDADPAELARVLAEAASNELDRALPKDEALDELRRRVSFLRAAMPDVELPPLDDDGLRAMLPHLAVGLRSLDDLRRLDWVERVRGELGHVGRQALDRHAPERIDVPSGSRVKVRYDPDGPVLAVRLQEVFGLLDTPRLAGGRVPVTMALLSPSLRPVQVTRDLRSFWETAYHEVRKELRARYPKHSWPEDPVHATPERRPRRR